MYRARMGRPSKCTPDLVASLAASLRASANVRLACQHVRIDPKTFYNWRDAAADEHRRYTEEHGTEPDADVDAGTWPYLHFLHATSKALADYQLENLALIGQAAAGTTTTRTTERTVTKTNGDTERIVETTTTQSRAWQAAAWLLERRFPSEYGRPQRVELTGEGGGPVQVESTEVLRERALAELAQVAERLASEPAAAN